LVEYNISRKKHITQDIWLSNCCAIAYVVSPKILESHGAYELNRQSQMRRQGCHCWKVQDEPFALCGQIGAAYVDLRNRVFRPHLIGFLLRATMKERKSALKRLTYFVLPQAVFPASMRHHTAAGGDIQVPCGINEWRKSEQRN